MDKTPEGETHPSETTEVAGQRYSIELLEGHAQEIPAVEVSLADLAEAVSGTHRYWEDANGVPFGPSEILQDPEAAQQRPEWHDHVATIQRANLDEPIWIMRESGLVFNGVHRLTRAFLEGRPSIRVRYFDRLPESAIVGP